ncbi:MAG: hypothetical protein VBE63_28695 [Lamprobacter sp.]|uniref:hypothetical protein n=1 Tax=Lamprobacter sp. TaxID=3100796 RepID=UPI002B2630C7|nr:hypothetical protein [Lamprobacter sp.]MEA3643875.1 hypothetical protein [Lamprobacter sp.]
MTFTVRDCPETPQAWCKARDALLDALSRSGVVLVHWVTEWQRRGVPHLHLACYWDRPTDPVEIITDWLRIAAPFGARSGGQYSHPIYDALGWNQYVSKHAARGLHHYQRSPENIPQTWRGLSTGRMWGKRGSWAVVDPSKLHLDNGSWWRLRRIVRSWRVADARRARPLNLRRVLSARRMLRCNSLKFSQVRGLSEWMPQDAMLRAVALVTGVDGADVEAL